MAEQSCYSPSFKKPSEVLRMRRKRARSEGVGAQSQSSAASGAGASSLSDIRPFSPGPLLYSHRQPGRGAKRRNPFANIENTYNSPNKRVCNEETPFSALCEEGEKQQRQEANANDFSLMFNGEPVHNKQPDEGSRKSQIPVPFPENVSLFEEDLFKEERSMLILKSPEASKIGNEPHQEMCREYPADWSLKTRLLITSTQSFSWAEHLKAHEVAQGLSLHCRAEYATLPQSIEDPRNCPELRCGFQQCLQYWQHPSLPWLSLFPRIGAERNFSGKSMPWAQDATVQQSLMSEWSVSLTSLYSLLKAKLCPYFYLCSYQFTVLFRAGGLSGAGGITALISPTTRGLREAMKADGIEFSLPLVEKRRKKDSSSHPNQAEDVDDDDGGCSLTSEQGHKDDKEEGDGGGDDDDGDDDDDDGCFSWLKEMGVQDKIKKPDAISIKLRREHHEVRLDHRPESVVLVEGSSTFTLINFLINCKSLVAAAGSQAGLPPTLLAPTAFRGATLHTLKARSVNVKTQVRTGFQDVCSLEVTGPIMPHALHSLTQLLRPAQKGDFSVALYTHEPSAVLNVPVSKPPETDCENSVVQDLSKCGLQQSTVNQLKELGTLGKGALRHLYMKDYSYSWRS